MPIPSNEHLYQAVIETAAGLAKRGMKGNALSISTVPGELLGAIRFALRQIERDRLPKELQQEIANEIAYLNSVLD
jgi:hypothetical protein